MPSGLVASLLRPGKPDAPSGQAGIGTATPPPPRQPRRGRAGRAARPGGPPNAGVARPSVIADDLAIRIIPAGTRPLACADIAIGDQVEIDGRNVYRRGAVIEKGDYLHPEDGDAFPCMIAAHIQVDTGDSGGAVLVRGIPAGVASRSFGGWLVFTPLAEGLAQLGLEPCTTPDCDVRRP